MTLLIVFTVMVVLVVAVFLRRANETTVKMADIPAVVDALTTTGKEDSWAQFCFGIDDKTVEDNAVNLQFSIKQGQVGFDWFLFCEVNRRDKEKFRQLAEDLGHTVAEHKYPNGAESLRAEGGDLVKLCETILIAFYQWPPAVGIGLIADGFEWPREGR